MVCSCQNKRKRVVRKRKVARKPATRRRGGFSVSGLLKTGLNKVKDLTSEQNLKKANEAIAIVDLANSLVGNPLGDVTALRLNTKGLFKK